MKIFKTRTQLSEYLAANADKIIGFVPTMGALHSGHLALVEASLKQADLTVCSIFVNPTQFTDPADLQKYPRPVESDIEKLESAGCQVLFLPEVSEMYADAENWHIELEYLETILEGKFRPGHYQGVTQIVKKLFDVVKPDFAFFGQKDFQQVRIIDFMIQKLGIKTQIIMCPIVRESSGLALSSRNIHLSETEKSNALVLYHSLMRTQQFFQKETIQQLQQNAAEMINENKAVHLEYFEIRNADNLKPAESKDEPLVALVAAKVGQTRLIDNFILR